MTGAAPIAARTDPTGRERRLSARVAHPIDVRIDGRLHAARDWSLTGFALMEPIPGHRVGDIVKAELVVRDQSGQSVAVQLTVTARVVRVDGDKARAFEFVERSPRTTEILHRIIGDYLAGQGPAVEKLLLDETEAPRTRRSGRTLRFLRGVVQLVVLVALVGTVAWLATSRVSRIEATYAAVAAPAVDVVAKSTGTVRAVAAEKGEAVAAGTPLVRISSARTAERLATLKAERAVLAALRERQAERLAEIERLGRTVVDVRARQIALLDEQVRATARRLSAERRRLDRLVALQARERARLNDVEAQAARVAAAEEDLAALRRDRENLAAERDLASAGFSRADQPDNVPTPAAMAARMRETEARIDGLDEQIAALRSATVVEAPCDCLVHAVFVQTGESVPEGGLVARLVTGEERYLDALVPAERARSLRVGAPVAIAFADGRTADGTLAEISYDNAPVGWVGLPERVPGRDRFALLRVRAAELDTTPIGLTASVETRPDWWLGIGERVARAREAIERNLPALPDLPAVPELPDLPEIPLRQAQAEPARDE